MHGTCIKIMEVMSVVIVA